MIITMAHPLDVRSSWIIEHGDVRPLGTRTRRYGRERQRAVIRERIASIGKTSLDNLTETRRILRERIARRTPRLPR